MYGDDRPGREPRGAKPYYIKVDKSGPEVSFVREYMEEAGK